MTYRRCLARVMAMFSRLGLPEAQARAPDPARSEAVPSTKNTISASLPWKVCTVPHSIWPSPASLTRLMQAFLTLRKGKITSHLGRRERRLLLKLMQAVHQGIQFVFDDWMSGLGGSHVQPGAVAKHTVERRFFGLALVVHTAMHHLFGVGDAVGHGDHGFDLRVIIAHEYCSLAAD